MEIQMVITFHSDVRFRHIIYRDARNWTRKLWSNSDGHNFKHGCTTEANDISRCSKLNNESSREIQMVITFHLDVRFRHIIYRAARNWTRKLWSNSDGHDFKHGCMTEAHDISRRSKFINGSSREIQMVVTFHSDVRFRHEIYRNARNWKRSSGRIQTTTTYDMDIRLRPMIYKGTWYWKMEVLEKFKWS